MFKEWDHKKYFIMQKAAGAAVAAAGIAGTAAGIWLSVNYECNLAGGIITTLLFGSMGLSLGLYIAMTKKMAVVNTFWFENGGDAQWEDKRFMELMEARERKDVRSFLEFVSESSVSYPFAVPYGDITDGMVEEIIEAYGGDLDEIDQEKMMEACKKTLGSKPAPFKMAI